MVWLLPQLGLPPEFFSQEIPLRVFICPSYRIPYTTSYPPYKYNRPRSKSPLALDSERALCPSSFPPPPTPTMRHPSTCRDSVQLPTATAFSICDSLLRMTHHLIATLPTPKLTVVRHTLNSLMTRADELLETADFDLSLNFDGLMVSPGESYRFHLGRLPIFTSFRKRPRFHPRRRRLWRSHGLDYRQQYQYWKRINLRVPVSSSSKHPQSSPCSCHDHSKPSPNPSPSSCSHPCPPSNPRSLPSRSFL